jgi:prepilin-type N-terminal cleavage/methylation domain-containing protein
MRRGFTIVELLVVVMILAIVVAIALPNFLEAQARAKVARARSEGRAIITAMAVYQADYSSDPEANPAQGTTRLDRLKVFTTPIAYLTKVPDDVFAPKIEDAWRPYALWGPAYFQAMRERGEVKLPPELANLHDVTVMLSRGPDGDFELDPRENREFTFEVILYDPTNGTVSNGDIFIRVN